MTAKVPVSRRAVLQRINRLIGPHEKLMTDRKGSGYFHLDVLNGKPLRYVANLQRAARRDFGVLKPHEEVR